MAIVAMFLPIVTGCSSDGADEEQQKEEEVEEKKIVYDAVYVSVDNSMLFMNLGKDGKASYCLDQYTMGYGDYNVADGKLTIANVYDGYTDELEISDTEDGGIRLKGHIRRNLTTEFTYIDMDFYKSTEPVTTDIKGEKWEHHGSRKDGFVVVYFTFDSEHEGNWQCYFTTGGLVDESKFHYVSRTYSDTDGNGNARTRKFAYRHNDSSKKPDLSLISESGEWTIAE